KQKQGKLLIPVSDYVTDFISTSIFASNAAAEKRGAEITRFLAAWLDAVDFMHKNRSEAVEIARKVTGYDRDIEEREFDLVLPMFSTTGKFSKVGIEVIARSFDAETREKHPDMSKLYSSKVLPKK